MAGAQIVEEVLAQIGNGIHVENEKVRPIIHHEALGFFEIEGVQEEQPLVEIALGGGRLRGDGPVIAAELGEVGRGRRIVGRQRRAACLATRSD